MREIQQYDHENLCVLWRDNARPRLPDATLGDIYDRQYRPAMERDILRLHTMFVQSHSKPNGVQFGSYAENLAGLKENIGRLDLPDTSPVDAAIEGLNARLARGDIRYCTTRFYDIQFEQDSFLRDNPQDPDYDAWRDRRYTCIGYNTSRAIKRFLCLYSSDDFQARLYRESLRGGDHLERYLTGEVLDDRYEIDRVILSNAMLEILVAHDLESRLHKVEKTHHTSMARSETDALERRNAMWLNNIAHQPNPGRNLRLIAGG